MEKHDAAMDRVKLAELNDRQKTMLDTAIEAMREAQAAAADAESRVRTLVAFVMPEHDGPVEFDVDTMSFYAEPQPDIAPEE